MKTCKTCGESKAFTEYHSNGLFKGKPKYKPSCKPCDYRLIRERFEGIIRDFYGELKCQRCGYDKSFAALDCHHREPSEKEYKINTLLTCNADRIRQELAKCDLVCANCHREIHAGSGLGHPSEVCTFAEKSSNLLLSTNS